jgi:hypothetical protein
LFMRMYVLCRRTLVSMRRGKCLAVVVEREHSCVCLCARTGGR